MVETALTLPNDLEQLGAGSSFLPELCGMLEHVQLLQDFDRSQIEKLAQYCSAYKVKPGILVFKEQSRGHFMCLLVDGRIEILKENKQVAIVRPGKSFGEMSILDGFPYSAGARAVEESRFIMITRHQFQRLADDKPDVALKLYQAMARLLSLRLRQTTGILVDFL